MVSSLWLATTVPSRIPATVAFQSDTKPPKWRRAVVAKETMAMRVPASASSITPLSPIICTSFMIT